MNKKVPEKVAALEGSMVGQVNVEIVLRNFMRTRVFLDHLVPKSSIFLYYVVVVGIVKHETIFQDDFEF